MRLLIVVSLAVAALAVASSPASARHLNYANFRVSFSGTETRT